MAKVGTVVIMLKGEHRGKRAILAKNLSSKYLLLIGLDAEFALTMTQASTVIITKKVAISEKAVKAISDKLAKVSNTELAMEKVAKKTGEKEFFAQGKAIDRTSQKVKDLSKDVRTLIEGDVKDADLKEYLKAPFTIDTGDKPHFWSF